MRDILGATRARSRFAPIVITCLVLSGCDRTPAPTAPDPQEAKQLLEHVLSAWQKGDSLESMKQASPSIVVTENRWKRGDKLTKFETAAPSKSFGAQQLFRVKLWLKDDKQKEVEEVAQYEVGTDPVRTVFRSMFD